MTTLIRTVEKISADITTLSDDLVCPDSEDVVSLHPDLANLCALKCLRAAVDLIEYDENRDAEKDDIKDQIDTLAYRLFKNL